MKKPSTRSRYKCGRCSSPMVLRANRTTGKQFYGCSKYPECDSTLDVDGFVSDYSSHDYESEMEYWDPNFDL
jgi:ssDNA-binding Zn-finger/Zn-ribbon topoisomerase 1